MYLLCTARDSGTPPPTREDAALYGGCLLPNRDPSIDGEKVAPSTSS